MAITALFPQAQGVFVAGTDTEIGKTVIAGAIARCLRSRGVRVGVFKPVASGCKLRREGLVSEDAEFLAHCANTASPLADVTPVCYRQAVTPALAAELAGEPVDWAEVAGAYGRVVAGHEAVVVEGVGGVMAPLDKGVVGLDLMERLALPVVVVCRNQLGAINHTLLTLAAVRARGLRVAGVVVNGHPTEGASLAQEQNPRLIRQYGKVSVLCVAPWDERTSVARGEVGPEVLAAVGLVDWQENLKLKI